MSKFDEALIELECLDIDMRDVMEDYIKNYDYDLIHKALEQAQKQEQEHLEYSKKVQEQFSNDTKRIGELESKLIKQEKLLKLYKELSNYVDEQTYAHELTEITRLKILIKVLENE